MKYLKMYENSNQSIWVLNAENIFESPGSFSSYIEIFDTRKSAENYLINVCNDIQINIMESNEDEYVDDIKDDFGGYILNDEKTCTQFLSDLCDQFSNGEFESGCYIFEKQIENAEIRKDIKIRIDAKKYNL